MSLSFYSEFFFEVPHIANDQVKSLLTFDLHICHSIFHFPQTYYILREVGACILLLLLLKFIRMQRREVWVKHYSNVTHFLLYPLIIAPHKVSEQFLCLGGERCLYFPLIFFLKADKCQLACPRELQYGGLEFLRCVNLKEVNKKH